MTGGKFHYKDGWLFSRLENGSVCIEKENILTPGFKIIIDSDSWASIVASVSIKGDTREAFDQAANLHMQN